MIDPAYWPLAALAPAALALLGPLTRPWRAPASTHPAGPAELDSFDPDEDPDVFDGTIWPGHDDDEDAVQMDVRVIRDAAAALLRHGRFLTRCTCGSLEISSAAPDRLLPHPVLGVIVQLSEKCASCDAEHVYAISSANYAAMVMWRTYEKSRTALSMFEMQGASEISIDVEREDIGPDA